MTQRQNRRAGVLMHISSLPGAYGIGDLGENAVLFAKILASAGISAWQMLPLAPTSPAVAHSPYSSPSAFAGNTLFINPDRLAELGLIDGDELWSDTVDSPGHVDYERASAAKSRILQICHRNFRTDEAYKTTFKDLSDAFWNFCVREAYWLEDYVLYSVLKEMEGGAAWSDWRREYRTRDWSVLDPLKREPEVASALDRCRFEQFLFAMQLEELRTACRELGVQLIGDLPIYVAYDSADVWGHQEFFELDTDGRPVCVAGVPPDYFSKTGQRWGNPIYRWDRMREDGYYWWLGRFRHALLGADLVRIDHFRGFLGYWEIPASEPTAVRGQWRPGPGTAFFHALKYCFADEGNGTLPFIAEDLGVLTDDVTAAMEEFGLPGMKILQFAFGPGAPDNPYIPHNHRRNCVVYVGTHDNNTTVGWWEEEATPLERRNFETYIDRKGLDAAAAADAMIRTAFASTADLAVVTVQDILGLGASARMNTPSTTEGNWAWRLEGYAPLEAKSAAMREMAVRYGRFHEPAPEPEEAPEA